MRIFKCGTCLEERNENYFTCAEVNGKISFTTKRCKYCQGIKNPRDKSKYKPILVDAPEIDKRKMYLTLLRLKGNNGMATDRDIVNIINCYTSIYETFPKFADKVDVYVFMWEKLKEFQLD